LCILIGTVNRTEKYPLSLENKKAELNVIKQIAKENDYNNSIINQKQYKKQFTNLMGNSSIADTQHEKKWVTFTYIGKETRHITKLFKNTKVKTAFRTNNIIKRILKPKPQIEHGNKYNSPGVYKLKCNDCHLQYIGQTGRSFLTIYKEHIRAIRYNKESSGYAQHILNTGHSYGNIEDIMDIIKIERKGKHLDTLEKFHIFCSYKLNKHLNDNNTDTQNPIFNTIYKQNDTNTIV
jgi:arginyl-tRNA--protein-N-Asp/Glu arginylyltransferase